MDHKSVHPRNDQPIPERASDSRISSPRNILNVLPKIEVRPVNGRVIGTKSPHIPPMVKRMIGEAAHMSGENKAIAEAFDVHPNTVTRAKKEDGVGEAKKDLDKEIHDKAVDAIVGMFTTSVSPEALARLDTKDATRSMKDLAKVAEAFGEKKGNVFNGPTIILFAPSEHTEDQYDVIDVEAREIK
jgi:hypothetical protein